MRLIAIAAACLLAACATANAQPTPAPAAAGAPVTIGEIPPSDSTSRNPATQNSGAYSLDSRHVSVTWRIRHLGLSLFTARFDKITGTLNFDSANPANSTVSVAIDANSVNTGVLDQNGARAFDHEIAEQVFGATANPNITFVSRSILVTGAETGQITGDLTLRGVTKPVVLDARFWGGRMHPFTGKPVMGFAARTLIKRSDFGAALSGPANGAVSDEVEILIEAEFLKT